MTPSRVERVARGLSSASTRDFELRQVALGGWLVREGDGTGGRENVKSPRPMLRPKFLSDEGVVRWSSVAMTRAARPRGWNDIRHAIGELRRITRDALEMPARPGGA